MSDDILETFEEGVATLTFNRPEARNAMTREMFDILLEALPRLGQTPEVRAVVLTGTGGAFCAGGDVKGFAKKADANDAGGYDFNQKVDDVRHRMEVSRYLHEIPKPTIAAIPGPAAGAGLSLALACDLRIAKKSAKITTAFSNIALAGDFGGSYFLTKLVGAAKARELYFTADVLNGEQAEAMGIVSKAVDDDAYADELKAYVANIASRPTVTLGFMKKNLNKALHESLKDVLDWEAVHMITTFDTEDHKGAAKAFVAKEKPVFNGR